MISLFCFVVFLIILHFFFKEINKHTTLGVIKREECDVNKEGEKSKRKEKKSKGIIKNIGGGLNENIDFFSSMLICA